MDNLSKSNKDRNRIEYFSNTPQLKQMNLDDSFHFPEEFYCVIDN